MDDTVRAAEAAEAQTWALWLARRAQTFSGHAAEREARFWLERARYWGRRKREALADAGVDR